MTEGYFLMRGLMAFLKLLVILTSIFIDEFGQGLEFLIRHSRRFDFFYAFPNAFEYFEFVFQSRQTSVEFLPFFERNDDRNFIAFAIVLNFACHGFYYNENFGGETIRIVN